MRKNLWITACLTVASFCAGAQSFTNPGFETWSNPSGLLQLEHPDGWYGADATLNDIGPLLMLFGITPKKQLAKSTDANSGSFAAQLTTKFLGDTVGNVPGLMLNAKISPNISAIGPNPDFSNILSMVSYSGGTPILGKTVTNVNAFVKLVGASQDQASIAVFAMQKAKTATNQDTLVAIGEGALLIDPNPANNYVKVTVPVIYTDQNNKAVDTLIVAFASSAVQNNAVRHEGNTLLVDDVSMTLNVLGIEQPVFRSDVVLVYPNPATGSVYFNLNTAEKAEDYTLSIYDVAGRTVKQQRLKQLINEQSLKGWTKGSYFYTLLNTRTQRAVKGQFAVQ